MLQPIPRTWGKKVSFRPLLFCEKKSKIVSRGEIMLRCKSNPTKKMGRKMESARALKGIIPALITPMHKDGTIHEAFLEKQVSYLSKAGVHGFLINGTTGEGPFLSRDEKRRTFVATRRASKGKQFLCLTCIQPSTELTLDEIFAFESLQPDFVVVTVPFYFAVSQREIIYHFEKTAKQSPFPVIAYNIPQCTYNKMDYKTMLEISSMENVVGLKDSSGDFATFSRVVRRKGKREFAWIQGEDSFDAESLILGASGVVTGLGNVWIEPYVEMFRAAEVGDFRRAQEFQKKINRLYKVLQVAGDRNIPAIKAATFFLGRCEKWLKPPLLPLNDEGLSRVKKVLADLGLTKATS
jgi:4-hydroxy-tetrahydrodipicolinate synthase